MKNGHEKAVQPGLEEWIKIPATVGFRLDDDHRRVLFERARVFGLSHHELARQYVIQMLHEGDERQQLIDAIVALQKELKEARTDIKVSTQELLVSKGGFPIDVARKWVNENFR